MRTVAFASVSFIVLSASAVGAQELSENWCLADPIQAGPAGRVWYVNKEFDTNDVWGPSVSIGDVLWRLDEVLQTTARHARPIVRNRIFNSSNQSCGWGYAATQSCMADSQFDDPSIDTQCYKLGRIPCDTTSDCEPNGCDADDGCVCIDELCRSNAQEVTAHANCNQNGACWVVTCSDSYTDALYGSDTRFNGRRWTHVIRHELGHTWGLEHVSDTTPTLPNCGETETSCWNGSNPGPCDDEVMCDAWVTNGTFCTNRVSFASGDGKGLRYMYPRYGTPTVQYGSRRLFKMGFSNSGTNLLQPTFGTLLLKNTYTSVFKPRMDCADDSTSEKNDCVLVRAIQSGSGNNLQVRRLNGWSTTNWSAYDSVVTLTPDVTFEPDIATNADASTAVIVYAGVEGHDYLTILAVDVDPGSQNYGSVAVTNTTIRTEVPPRVAFIDGLNEWVIAAADDDRLRLFSLDESTMTVSESGIRTSYTDYASWGDHLTSDFDIDCRKDTFTATPPWSSSSGTATECTIVAPLRNPSTEGGKVSRYRFNASKKNIGAWWEWGMWQFTQESWSVLASPWRVTAVAGVAHTEGAEIVASFSDSLTGASDSTNSTIRRYTSNAMTTTSQSPIYYKSDAETCEVTPDGATSIPALTPYGGSNIAYCSTCAANRGAIEAVGWGRRDDHDDFCF